MKFTFQRISKDNRIPRSTSFKCWLMTALDATAGSQQKKSLITIRVVDEEESKNLNSQYRNKDYSTNVLSFNYGETPLEMLEMTEKILGDIVICAPITIKEAQEQAKDIKAHFAHLTIHGVLHLLGYDHEKINDAKKMEQFEIIILKSLGFKNPYDIKKN